MAIKLIAIDLDDTLLDNRQQRVAYLDCLARIVNAANVAHPPCHAQRQQCKITLMHQMPAY